MKKHFFLLALLILVLYSCDKELIEDFIITNSHNNDIHVNAENMNGVVIRDTITIGETSYLFYTNTGYGNSIYKFELKTLFKYFEINSGSIPSKLDYLNDTMWEYIELSDTHAEYRLVIDSTHFKDF